MKLFHILPLLLFLQSCNSQKAEEGKEDTDKRVSIGNVIQIINEIDESLAFKKSLGQTSKMMRVEELGDWRSRLKDIDCYDASTVINNVEVKVHFRTYDDPNLLDSGSISLRYKSSEFKVNEEEIKKLAEKYIRGFIVKFIDTDSLQKKEWSSLYDLKPKEYVPSAHTTLYKGYFIDTYRSGDFVDWKTHETITFMIE